VSDHEALRGACLQNHYGRGNQRADNCCRFSPSGRLGRRSPPAHYKLTPMGSERAGNAEATIPPWSGRLYTPVPGYQPGMRRPDPFVGEKPVFSITRANLECTPTSCPRRQGAVRQFPDYRMDVYPTHRTAAAPQWVYENIFRNATRAHAASAGIAYWR